MIYAYPGTASRGSYAGPETRELGQEARALLLKRGVCLKEVQLPLVCLDDRYLLLGPRLGRGEGNARIVALEPGEYGLGPVDHAGRDSR